MVPVLAGLWAVGKGQGLLAVLCPIVTTSWGPVLVSI